MVSTINYPTTGFNIDLLKIINPSTTELKTLTASPSKQGGDGLKSLVIKHEKSVIGLAQWLGKSNLVSKLNYQLNSTRAFDNNQHEVIFNFSLSERFSNHFILLKGLFAFHNIPSVSIHADRASRTFKVEIRADQAQDIIDYFNLIINSLVKEINFKRILKGVIKLEQRIKRERDLAYGSLKAAV